MRKQCFSSLRQGILFQASLEGSTCAAASSGAFLFAIRLTLFLPYNRVHVSISPGFPGSLGFLNNLSTGDIGWHLLDLIDRKSRVFLWFLRSEYPFCVCFRPGLYAELLSSENKSHSPRLSL